MLNLLHVVRTAVALGVSTMLAAAVAGQGDANIVQVPDGGRLDALDPDGNIVGACPLEHTDVKVDISGHFTRVSLRQVYVNPYDFKIEAVYTFPMSHRAAVDSLTMIVGERVVEGEVKERDEARRIYEAARAQGYVASLLEQERPNIFTQSVANIEPGREVIVEISYVEVLEAKDGVYSFDFPMVVGPRYTPGASTVSPATVPAELEIRRGVILLGPAKLTPGEQGVVDDLGTLQVGKLSALLTAAKPIKQPGESWYPLEKNEAGEESRAFPDFWHGFEAEYCDGSKELGRLFVDGTGHINGRWFYTDPKVIKDMGTGFAQDTDQVPDASKVTPMPVRPGVRAGHDISVSVSINTGGPKIGEVKSISHDLMFENHEARELGNLDSRVELALAEKSTIPNKDFALEWSLESGATIAEAILTHTAGNDKGNFISLILNPPDRVDEETVRDREVIFVMDTSGSMNGYPIAKSKEVMRRIFDGMRPDDRFNLITFAGHTQILWDESKFATRDNRAEAMRLIDSRQGSGGTEMMKAIEAALVQTVEEGAAGDEPITPEELVDMAANGQRVTVLIPYTQIAERGGGGHSVNVKGGGTIIMQMRGGVMLPSVLQPEGISTLVSGRWEKTATGSVLAAHKAEIPTPKPVTVEPMRIVVFLTDGYVSNDMAIIDAIEKNRGTTRVFSFGIGNSVNRFLIDGMADAGRGEAEVVLLESDADEAVARLTKRLQTPVLTDISLTFSDDLGVSDVLPGTKRGEIPDLFDAEPIVVHAKYGNTGDGTVTIRGRTAKGIYERTIPITLPETNESNDTIGTLWARAKIDGLMQGNLAEIQRGTPSVELKNEIVQVGVTYQIMSQFTSFVAVEKSRVTIGGKAVLVPVPIEMADGVSYEGVFGEDGQAVRNEQGGLKLGLVAQASPSVDTRTAGFDRFETGAGAPARRSLGRVATAAQPAPAPMRSRGGAVAGRGRGTEMLRSEVRYRMPAGGGGGGGSGGGRGQLAGEELDFAWQLERESTIDGKSIAELNEQLEKNADNLDNESPSKVLLTMLFGRTDQKLFVERLSVTISEYAGAGDHEAARTLAEAIGAVYPDNDITKKLVRIFDDGSLNDDARAKAVALVAEDSRAEIERRIAADLRRAILKSKMPETLVPFAEGQGLPDELVQMYDGPWPQGAEWYEGGALLSVLVKELNDETVDGLESLGLKIVDRIDESSFVIAAVPLGQIDSLALLDGVRRIEPVEVGLRESN